MPDVQNFTQLRAALATALGHAQALVNAIDDAEASKMLPNEEYGELIEAADEMRDRLWRLVGREWPYE